MSEIWKDVVEYEGYYQVSNLGKVRSMDRVVKSKGRNKRLKGVMLHPSLSGTARSYLTVQLSKNGRQICSRVHALVALAFMGPPPEGMEVLHGVEGSLVNTLENLRYGTHKENQKQMMEEGNTTGKRVRRSDGKEFNSAAEAERLTGVNRTNISSVCNKYIDPSGFPVLTAGGFSWEFI